MYLIKRKKGQISVDFILAFMFLMIVSLFLYESELTFTNDSTNAIIANKLYAVVDTFENYAMLSYSENETLLLTLKPVGDISYTIRASTKLINVSRETYVIFYPEKDGVRIEGRDVVNTSVDVGNKVQLIANVGKNNITLSKNTLVNIK
ncbi:conserved hypothetical protein [Methanocaldococcus vulcanius M7]|uniref:Flagellin n=1 Tax=Methanocaldococcus vulcanius (strain ATCC 700851 / DSM 12094 / M7) TaxID=579137 RepID=C9RIG2_METVM|nr:hypothetical protein [Methanocaldococcus vulcanius]ACX73364.1 conserved hypothetical protein [Methanocaldococcus vulcanius M7]